ncbi:helix-turn-helix domain-containing protein [Chelatococcus composti]|jgi:transcriptional regulator with XRE-family HTH domain|uniref:Transcriptional regulator with XRE-family HTH domain n=1 Tax=Chelatococcus composti TaxID=1743235 RepID=A0A841K8J5_9HYPH|nr:helix-turn-helix domain-containing protein [Chelatococcus composti]MBB6168625.1 transcriptional regulator with XRE-family HTH domain [Chelatococcus composti]MBS7736296.1 helix-turn-helix domain-containing protein [Chelatococcus composti]PZN44886.1 MAG: XRE family transcriptional regulator [Pseudomonadota bacterium]GGG41475.1 XRE family transcriptional regulator [Chelatococcus composti]
MPQIGSHLKELRRRRNISVRELALRSGVSHSAISLIERDRMSPSVDTLSAILDALGTTLPGFFADLYSRVPYSPFYAAHEWVEIGKAASISYRMVGLNHPNRQMLVLHETYARGADTGEAVAHSAQEAGLVTRGAVELTVGSESRVLRAGDGYYFDSRQPHRFRNVADGESEIVSAMTPPTY